MSIVNLHPCDHCKEEVFLKYKYCRKCARRWKKDAPDILRTRAEIKLIKRLKKDEKRTRSMERNVKKWTKLPAKNRKKSKVIEALLSGQSAQEIIDKRTEWKPVAIVVKK